MSTSRINGVTLFWERRGDRGPPLVLVHGSWGDHHNWDAVVPELAGSFRVITYDRRGHSQSERTAGQGHIDEDVADLGALLEHLQLAPAHVVGNSYGAAITLKLACARPELFASMAAHEPPLIGMLGDHPSVPIVRRRIGAVLALLKAGRDEEGARLFVETVGLGPGMWARLPPEMHETFVRNAPTFLDEMNEPESVMAVDLRRLSAFDRPALVSQGDQSPPFFSVIFDQIAAAMPHARRHVFKGAGHVPHVTHPEEFVRVISAHVAGSSRVSKPGGRPPPERARPGSGA
jgi:pimeloyl-ACP methyl ester carboxylesterase